MNRPIEENWSTLPKHIIINLGSYLPLYFQFELRLLNNHWSKAMNNLLFYSLETFKSDYIFPIVEKYGVYVKFISDTVLHSVSIQKLQQFCHRVDQLSIILLPSSLSKIIQLLEAFPSLIKINVYNYIESDSPQNSSLNTITKLISQMKSLKSIEYSTCEPNEELLVKLYELELNCLDILSQSHNIDQFREQYTKGSKVSKVNWSIDYSRSDPEVQKRSNLITPNFLLSYNTLKSLFVWTELYSDSEGSINTYLSQEFLKLLNNPNFSKLKDLEWLYLWSDNLNTCTLFDKPIPNTNCWPNLSRISLFLVDGHLLTYITQHCPNLVELVSISPLTLPNYSNHLELEPLKKLKRLLIGGFEKKLINNENIIRHIFPNVGTLNLRYKLKSNSTDKVTMDTYYIPILFPNLKFCILASPECELVNLINNYNNELGWEELFIEITHTNSHLLSSLLDKLPNVRLVYLNLRSTNNIQSSKREGVRYFNASRSDDMEFSFNSVNEL